ncbi:MAG: nitroreductase family protein [Dehalococcoidales bacterium]|nr:MAG: nitroreductase family protein [Dehalococcoidales bacterium]
MNIVEINHDTCTKCGICNFVCSAGLIESDNQNYPVSIPELDEACNRCGACVAACPTGSLNHRDLPLEKSPSIDNQLKVGLEQCEQLIKSRRSVRSYKDKKVPREEITRLIDAARYAPTGGNSQNVKWLVIDNQETMQRLREIGRTFVIEAFANIPAYTSRLELCKKRRDAGFDIFLHGAPVLVNTYGEENMPIAAIDSTIALSYFDLLANSTGLGCCWIGLFSAAANNLPKIKDILGLPEGNQVYGSMIVGYPKYIYPRIPVRNLANIEWL